VEGLPGRLHSFVGESLQLTKIPRGDRPSGEMPAGQLAALTEELVELVDVTSSLREVSQPVERVLVAGIGQLAQDVMIGLAHGRVRRGVGHTIRVQPSTCWKVKPEEVRC
jgi:hypothetical protein